MSDNDIDKSELASEQLDLSPETGDGLLEAEKIHEVARGLERVPDINLTGHSDEYLADLAAACKRIENAAGEARKDGYENELDERVDDGESVGPLTKQSGRNTWVADTEGAFAAVADAGEDPMNVAKVSISDLRDVLGTRADDYIGESTYTFFRRNP